MKIVVSVKPFVTITASPAPIETIPTHLPTKCELCLKDLEVITPASATRYVRYSDWKRCAFFVKILFMVIINACLLRSVNFVWKISKSSPLLQLHGTSDIQTGNDVLSFAKILFMVIINACTRKWCSDDYKVKVGDKLQFCQSWGFPRSEKDQFRPFLT